MEEKIERKLQPEFQPEFQSDLVRLIQTRRSIRKYQPRQVPRELLAQVLEAGSYAPSAGGGQRTILVGVQDTALCEKLGRLNVSCMDRSHLAGNYVSAEQPSIIDDPSIKSGFYGAPTVCVVFSRDKFLYSIPDAFCAAENMVLTAHALGLSSCIIARAENTFATEYGRQLMQTWNIPADYAARCFVLLGYCEGDYPAIKPRKEGRVKIIE
jgi:nitroreductase